MTEQELIDAGFEKETANHMETGNGYDYYYYLLELCEGISLISSDSDEVVDGNWIIKSFDVPALKIETKVHLDEFLEIVRTLIKC